jgi:glycosyltransferase involved in cell wall biosynthesis
MNLRIVVLVHQLTLTGVPRLTVDAVEALQRNNSVRLVSWDGGPLVDEARRFAPPTVLWHAGPTRLLPGRLRSDRAGRVFARVTWRLRAARAAVALGRWKPQVVYVCSVEALPLVGMLQLGGLPVVVHVHELGFALAWFDRSHPGLIKSVPTRYLAPSKAVAGDLVRSYGVAPDAVTVITPYALPQLPAAAKPVPDADGPVVVGGAGKPSWTKGIDLWLLAAREAVDRLGPGRLRFVWVGWRDDQEGLRFRTMVSKLGLEGVVELVPETDRPQDVFIRFDMFAMTSWEESASLVVLEAMAMAIPVLCFEQTGGPAEEVAGAGIVIPSMSPHLLADAIVDLANNPAGREAMGRAGWERAGSEYSRERSLEALAGALESVAVSRR